MTSSLHRASPSSTRSQGRNPLVATSPQTGKLLIRVLDREALSASFLSARYLFALAPWSLFFASHRPAKERPTRKQPLDRIRVVLTYMLSFVVSCGSSFIRLLATIVSATTGRHASLECCSIYRTRHTMGPLSEVLSTKEQMLLLSSDTPYGIALQTASITDWTRYRRHP
ncbi:hypothetical protein EDB92DRAFT_127178 [Lactarius akahatsu]|uniref:Uncharacterized protein n=1 Tax=Lactarius akahatsu TaxID=416441 RepID=A0AAD4LAD4_9AGAM|nr:hypothetical protein EDB92DRAFT_127178 [Lactarius akahatsu]